MCQCQQSGFNGYFIYSAEHKAAEVVVIFDIAKDGFYIPGSFLSMI
jgi:hypothetical protein